MYIWKYEAYLKKGVSHTLNNTECQDRVLIKETDSCIVAALADGLGSLKFSEVAAQIATETVCGLFCFDRKLTSNLADTSFVRKYILSNVTGKIGQKADELETGINEMDCTLVFVYISKKDGNVFIGRLGDSAVCVIKSSDSFVINDSDASANGTNAVLDKDAINNFEIKQYNILRDKILGFVLSSDGLDNELYMKGSPHVNKNAEIYFNSVLEASPSQIIEKRIKELTEDEFTAFDDDISVAVLSCTSKKISLPADPTWLCVCGERNPLQSTYCHNCHKDFSVVYQNIVFRQFGGKAPFFEKINQNPEEEKKLIGLQAKAAVQQNVIEPPVQNQTESAPFINTPSAPKKNTNNPINNNFNNTEANTMPANNYNNQTPVAPAKQNSGSNSSKPGAATLIIGLIGLVLGILIGFVVAKAGMSKDIKEMSGKLDSLMASTSAAVSTTTTTTTTASTEQNYNGGQNDFDSYKLPEVPDISVNSEYDRQSWNRTRGNANESSQNYQYGNTTTSVSGGIG